MAVTSLRARIARRGLIAAVEMMRATSGGLPDPDSPVEELEEYALSVRESLERLAARIRVPGGARIEEVDAGVPALLVADPTVEASDRMVLHLHGGAYAFGSPRTHLGLGLSLSRVARAPVLLPDYRLSPESTYPAAFDDAVAAYRWVTEDRGVAPERLAVTGDSAGGGLALGVLVGVRDRGDPLPTCYVGMSPWTDLACTGESMVELDGVDPWIPAGLARRAATAYAGELPLDDPRVSPLYADLSGLPPMLVHVGSDEVLLDDARRLVERARQAGVDASVGIFDGLWHVFHAFPGFPESRYALREIGGFVRRHTLPLELQLSA